MRIYLDNAVTTPVLPQVVEVMTKVLKENYGNPSSLHAEGRAARAIIEKCRKKVAQSIGASIGEIFFTSGGTESNNMALKCSVRDLGVTRIISSPVEHHCVLHSLERIKEDRGTEIVLLTVDKYGRFDLDELRHLLQDGSKKTLVSLMHANNELGTMIDLNEVSEICQEYNAFFHSDTVQSLGYFPIDVSKTKINFLSGSAHKFHGPKGIGFIYVNGENKVKALVDGGSQERNMRGGTENISGIAGMATALEYAIDHMEENRKKITALKNQFVAALKNEFVDIQINGDDGGLSNYKVVNVCFPPSPKAPLLLMNLDIAGISTSGGSACSSGAEQGSHVLRAIGSDPDRKSIRFSFSHLNTPKEVETVIGRLKPILQVPV